MSELAAPQPAAELLLLNASSYIVLDRNIQLDQGALVGFSFRTCSAGGDLLRQVDATGSKSFILNFSAAGGLRLTLTDGVDQRVLESGSGLADGAWHTVRLGVSPSRTTVCLSVDAVGPDTECAEPRTGPAVVTPVSQNVVARMEAADSLLAMLDFASSSTSGLRLGGGGLVGCVREGPGVRLGGLADSSAIMWGPCLLPQTCSGKTIICIVFVLVATEFPPFPTVFFSL